MDIINKSFPHLKEVVEIATKPLSHLLGTDSSFLKLLKNLTWQNPEQLFVAQELINKVKSKCCGIKVKYHSYENL